MLSRIRLVFYFLILLTFYNCQKDTTTKIGLLMDNLTTERWAKDKEIIIRRATELNAEVYVKIAHGDQQIQFEQAKQLIDTGVDVLIVVPCDYEKSATIIDVAHEANIKVIAYDRLIRGADLDFYISFDNVEVGKLQAEYLTTVKPVGNYALIGGASIDNNSYLIKLGQMGILQPLVEKGDINIICNQFVNTWSEQEGYKKAIQCLDSTKNEVDVIIAANDVLASGVVKALEEKDMINKVLVAGQDADLKACKRIMQGKQSMTVYKPIEKLAIPAVEIAVKLSADEPLPDFCSSINNGLKWVPCILMQPITVNAETIPMTVVADGYQTEENIKDEE